LPPSEIIASRASSEDAWPEVLIPNKSKQAGPDQGSDLLAFIKIASKIRVEEYVSSITLDE
jgi:hypothetical protein